MYPGLLADLTEVERMAYDLEPTRAGKHRVLRRALKRIETEEIAAGLPPRPKPLPILPVNRKGIV